MSAVKIKENVYYVGVQDPNLKVFDIIMETEFGTTYNAYLVTGEKTALIETVHDKSVQQYIDNINEIVNVNNIDYVICNHTEPDHSGSLVKLLEINPKIEVIGTTAAIRNLKEITNSTFCERVVKDGESLDLGNGVVLKFIIAPNLHWPDTMMTYMESEKVLFSCDVLGAHYCGREITDAGIINKADYEKAFKQYYDAIVSPFGAFVQSGLKKLDGIEIEVVCNSHGPVLTSLIADGIKKYNEWSKPQVHEQKIGSIFYVSAYGYTQKMAQVINDTLNSEGIKTQLYNIIEHDIVNLRHIMNTSDVVLFGTPTINRNALEPVWEILAGIDMINAKSKMFGVFGSYGWSGEGCPLVEQYLKALKLHTFETPLTTVFNPSDTKLQETAEYAKRLAESFR